MDDNQRTLKTYETFAEDYAQINQHNDTIKQQRDFFASLLLGNVIWDLGCGTGRDVDAFVKKGFSATGFDASNAMLFQAQKHFPDNQYELLNLLDKDWHSQEKVDGIWACASLLHFQVDEFKEVFAHALNHLKTNGIFYFSVKIKNILCFETIDGRFFQYYTRDWLLDFIDSFPELEIVFCDENINRTDTFISFYLRKL